MGVRDGMRDLGVEVHPKTVETWFRGTAMPAYGNLVALAQLFHELPPTLAEVCPESTVRVEGVEDRSPDTAGTGIWASRSSQGRASSRLIEPGGMPHQDSLVSVSRKCHWVPPTDLKASI
jgi:hypothetical protein